MTTVATTTTHTTNATTPGNTSGKPSSAATTVAKATSNTDASSAKLGDATEVDVSKAAHSYITKLAVGTDASSIWNSGAFSTGGTGQATGIKSLDEIAQERTTALADKISAAFKAKGIPLDDSIKLKLDSLGQVTTDSPYKKKIEKLFKDDPDLAKEFKDVAGLNSMKAAQKALEAFAREKKDARNDDERTAAYGRYNARLMKSQALSGTMTLDDGKLRSASVDFMDKAVGEIEAPEASTKAQQVTGQKISRFV